LSGALGKTDLDNTDVARDHSFHCIAEAESLGAAGYTRHVGLTVSTFQCRPEFTLPWGNRAHLRQLGLVLAPAFGVGVGLSLDYLLTHDGKHTLFFRGNLMDDQQQYQPYLPGLSPTRSVDDHSRGFVIGETAILSPAMVNNFRYGLTRQSQGTIGNTDSQTIFFRGLNDNSDPSAPYSALYSHSLQVPVHNFVDDVSWKKGNHSLTFGTNIRLIRNPRTSWTSSFSRYRCARTPTSAPTTRAS